MRSLTLAALAALLVPAGSALAQDAQPQVAPPPPVILPVEPTSPPPAPPRPTVQPSGKPSLGESALSWAANRARPQAVLHVETEVTPDTDFREVDHGAVLLSQRVRPAGRARITRGLRREAYGPAGSVLWPGVGPGGEYWCWRNDNPDTVLAEGPVYCYLDRDRDGQFDQLMETDPPQAGIFTSRFQFKEISRDERPRGPAALYEIDTDALGDFEEVVGLRYVGPVRGMVSPDGRFGPGRVQIDIVTGPDLANLSIVESVYVVLNAGGAGSLTLPNGMGLDVSNVRDDGFAEVRLRSGMRLGRGLLLHRQ